LHNISNSPHPRTIYWTIVAIIFGLVLLAVVSFHPSAPDWISEAAHAEFAAKNAADSPATQVAKHGQPISARAEESVRFIDASLPIEMPGRYRNS
jgi:hypothetical protein